MVTNTQDYAQHLKGLSPIGVAAARFAIEKPGLSMPQKNRVAAAIGVRDKMNRLERNVVRALVTEAKAEWPDVPPSMPPGTQPDDMERASLYYRFAEEEADRRWNRRARVMTAAGVALGFLVTWGLLAYTHMQ